MTSLKTKTASWTVSLNLTLSFYQTNYFRRISLGILYFIFFFICTTFNAFYRMYPSPCSHQHNPLEPGHQNPPFPPNLCLYPTRRISLCGFQCIWKCRWDDQLHLLSRFSINWKCISTMLLQTKNRELKHRNISSWRRFIFREWTGSRTAFLARIFNLSSARITTTDASRVKRREN